MDSINLRHFPQTDPPSCSTKDKMREQIAKEMAEYVARGGRVYQASLPEYQKHGKKVTQNEMRLIKKRMRFTQKQTL